MAAVKQVRTERLIFEGALLAMGAAFLFAFTDMLIKFLSEGYALHQVVFLRTVVALPVFLIFVVPFLGGWQVFRTRCPSMHIIRGGCTVFTNTFLFLGLASLPLADAVAIFFVAPLIVTLFSVVILGEPVGPRRWTAVVVGFAGVLLIMRPGTSAFQLASVFPIIAATIYALTNIITRYMGGSESSATMAAYSQLTLLLATITIGIAIGDGKYAGLVNKDLDFLVRPWGSIARFDYLIFAILGVGGLLGSLCIMQAYRLSEAAFVASFEYFAIPMAVFWGITVFGTWPDRTAWVGITLILGSGLFLVWRETRKGTPGDSLPRCDRD